eukprot:3959563-Pleurochrysis_carterae.AAC.1
MAAPRNQPVWRYVARANRHYGTCTLRGVPRTHGAVFGVEAEYYVYYGTCIILRDVPVPVASTARHARIAPDCPAAQPLASAQQRKRSQSRQQLTAPCTTCEGQAHSRCAQGERPKRQEGERNEGYGKATNEEKAAGGASTAKRGISD